ncbi:LOW QUALITY PROTEIN: 60S ribosomal protein L7, partial [Galemys pyrenaicus]
AKRKLICDKAEHNARNMGRCEELRLQGRMASKTGKFYILSEPKLAFVIRIRGISDLNPKIQKVLQLLCIHLIFNSTFVKLNKALANMLRIEYILYPVLKELNEWIYKHRYGRINKKQNALRDSSLAVPLQIWHLLYGGSDSGIKKKTTHFVEVGEAGNREDRLLWL